MDASSSCAPSDGRRQDSSRETEAESHSQSASPGHAASPASAKRIERKRTAAESDSHSQAGRITRPPSLASAKFPLCHAYTECLFVVLYRAGQYRVSYEKFMCCVLNNKTKPEGAWLVAYIVGRKRGYKKKRRHKCLAAHTRIHHTTPHNSPHMVWWCASARAALRAWRICASTLVSSSSVARGPLNNLQARVV